MPSLFLSLSPPPSPPRDVDIYSSGPASRLAGRTGGRMGGRTGAQTDGRTDGRTDGWTDGRSVLRPFVAPESDAVDLRASVRAFGRAL